VVGLKDQCFGVEVEMTGLTREDAAQALAEYFGTRPRHRGGAYDTWIVKDVEGKEWKLMSDASIRTEIPAADGYGYEDIGDRDYMVEMVTPKQRGSSPFGAWAPAPSGTISWPFPRLPGAPRTGDLPWKT